jgi:hypothetical protein
MRASAPSLVDKWPRWMRPWSAQKVCTNMYICTYTAAAAAAAAWWENVEAAQGRIILSRCDTVLGLQSCAGQASPGGTSIHSLLPHAHAVRYTSRYLNRGANMRHSGAPWPADVCTIGGAKRPPARKTCDGRGAPWRAMADPPGLFSIL